MKIEQCLKKAKTYKIAINILDTLQFFKTKLQQKIHVIVKPVHFSLRSKPKMPNSQYLKSKYTKNIQ